MKSFSFCFYRLLQLVYIGSFWLRGCIFFGFVVFGGASVDGVFGVVRREAGAGPASGRHQKRTNGDAGGGSKEAILAKIGLFAYVSSLALLFPLICLPLAFFCSACVLYASKPVANLSRAPDALQYCTVHRLDTPLHDHIESLCRRALIRPSTFPATWTPGTWWPEMQEASWAGQGAYCRHGGIDTKFGAGLLADSVHATQLPPRAGGYSMFRADSLQYMKSMGGYGTVRSPNR